MPRQKYHRDRIYRIIGEPPPGALVVGYVRYSSELQDPATIVTQKRVISEFAEKKGWIILRWYEEPEQSAKYEDIEARPQFAQLFRDAEVHQFQAVLCYANDRWSRNTALTLLSLSRLRKDGIWWATADGVWDLDKAQQDGTGVGFLIDTLMGESYLRHLSKRTIDGKEDRARDGYHNGNVSFGYMAPDYQHAPDGTRLRRMPVRPDPITFYALVRIGELTAQGWSDRAIADELEPYLSKTARFGERLLTKDTIAAIRRSAFPREFAPGCGHGTIVTPSNDLVEGRHQAAWPYELWQRMVEVKMQHFHRPTQQAQRHPHAFSQIIVCAACRRRLRVTLPNGVPYYKDTSKIRKLDCPLPEALSIKEATVLYQFGDLLRSINLPERWQETISAWVPQGNAEDRRAAHLEQRRLELEAEQKRLVTAFAKGYLTEEDLDAQAAPLRAELFALPLRLAHNAVQETLNVGETLEEVASYWSEAAHEQRQEIVTGLLAGEGLIYDLERRAIVGLLPHASVLPVLTLGLQHTAQWEQRDGGLWLLQDSWPPKQDLTKRHIPPPPPPSLSPAQREEAVKLLREPGMSLRNVASRLGTSRATIHRLAQQEGIQLQPSRKLSDEQRLEAFALLEQGMSLRQVAKQFGIGAESLRRLVARHTSGGER